MRSLRLLVPSLAVTALVLTGCSDDGDGKADKDDATTSASPTRDDNGLSLVDCTEAPEEDYAGAYEAGEVDWADEQAALIEGVLEDGGEVRYCIDPSGVGHYFAVLDGKYDETIAQQTCEAGTVSLVDRPGFVHVTFDDQTVDCTKL